MAETADVSIEDSSHGACIWVRSLVVVAFDVSTGHVLEQIVPAGSLNEDEQARIRMPAMPDCNTSQLGDSFYCFRTRKSGGLPLFSTPLLEQTFEYCYALFRQERNANCARGVFQKVCDLWCSVASHLQTICKCLHAVHIRAHCGLAVADLVLL
jgi:hypothetical protein